MSNRLEELYKTMCDEAPYGFHPSIKKYIVELAEIYAKECSQASLEKASENVDPNLTYDYWSEINNIKQISESITHPDNIIIL